MRPAGPDTRPSAPDIRPVGDRALLVDVGTLTIAMAWQSALQSDPLDGQLEVVGAARTVLVRFDSAAAAEAAVASLLALTPAQAGIAAPREHTLDVLYDGDDLAETSRLLDMSPDALVDAHTATVWQAAFGGFAPGFAYCTAISGPAADEPLWDVPRLAEPRTAVPPGAVGLAGAFSAAYPRRSPGGWRLIGRTDAVLWAGESERPALLTPGDRVRYRAVRAFARTVDPDRPRPESGESPDEVHAADGDSDTGTGDTGQDEIGPGDTGHGDTSPGDTDSAPRTRTVLRVDDPGLLTLIEDAGRPGHGALGVSPSGAADLASAEAANTAVGNPPGAPVLEVAGTARLTCVADVVVAVAGAACGTTVAPQLLRAGDTLGLDPAPDLARSYLAVRGGVSAAHEVGSASADVLAGLGPDPLFAGAEVAVPVRGPAASVGYGTQNPARVRRDEQRAAASAAQPSAGERATQEEGSAGLDAAGSDAAGPDAVVLRAVAGPRDDWFADEEFARFAAMRWVVGEQSNRVGTRLEPADGAAALTRRRDGELASEGTVTGAVQVPPSGTPVVFGPDRPVTGGYPVIATVLADDLDVLAQLTPGSSVRFDVVEGPARV